MQRKVDRVREARLAALQSEDDAATEINGRKRNAVGKETLPLIVCASLVDKAPNLAGLARTCEVFACEQLVVADAAITSKKEFQQIAATAEKWIPIAGVPPAELRGWLEQRRGDGYSVVALEQATGSSDLAARDLSLPTPAVLLLGAEGEGVPNALFDLVDCCVEIPQLGVVRSLNVHVSGAIAVWMFARQVLLKAAGPAGDIHAELAALKADLKISRRRPRSSYGCSVRRYAAAREEDHGQPCQKKKLAAAAAPPPPGSPKTPNEEKEAA